MSLATVSLLVVWFTAGAWITNAQVTFWCDSEGVMTLTSFPSKANKIALIDNVPTAITGSTELNIDVGKDTVVIVAFSDYDMSSVFAADTEAYTLQCNEIDTAGVSATVMANAAASISTELNTVMPTFPILTGFTSDLSTFAPLTSVTIGMWFLFVIHIPDVYKMNVDRCDGYAADGGQKVAGFPPIHLLGKNGCMDHAQNYRGTIMMNLQLYPIDAVVPRHDVYVSSITGFKFFGHESILIECSITLCPKDGDCAVSWSWLDCNRQKRSYSEPKDDGSFSMITRNVIKVLDPYTLGTASVLSANMSAILLSAIALLLVLE